MNVKVGISSFEKICILVVGLDATLRCYSLEQPQAPRWCIPIPLNAEQRRGMTTLGSSTASLVQCVCSSFGGAESEATSVDTAPCPVEAFQGNKRTPDSTPADTPRPSPRPREDPNPRVNAELTGPSCGSAARAVAPEVDWARRVLHPSNWLAALAPSRLRAVAAPFGDALEGGLPCEAAVHGVQEGRGVRWYWRHPRLGWIPYQMAQNKWNGGSERPGSDSQPPSHRIVSLRRTEEQYLEVDTSSGTWHVASLEDDASDGTEVTTWHTSPSPLSLQLKDSSMSDCAVAQRRAVLGIHVLSSVVQVSWYDKFRNRRRRSIRHHVQLIDHTLELGLLTKEPIHNDNNSSTYNNMSQEISSSAILLRGMRDEGSSSSDEGPFMYPQTRMRSWNPRFVSQTMTIPALVMFKQRGSDGSDTDDETHNILITWASNTEEITTMSDHSVRLGQTTGLSVVAAFMLDFRLCDEGRLTQLSVLQSFEDTTQAITSVLLSDHILVPYSNELPMRPHVMIIPPKNLTGKQKMRLKVSPDRITRRGSGGLTRRHEDRKRFITYAVDSSSSDPEDSTDRNELAHSRAMKSVRHAISCESSVQILKDSPPQPPHDAEPFSSFFDENFDPLLLLGAGAFGVVLLARHRLTGAPYAIKVLVVRDYASEKDVLQEVRVHSVLTDPHLVRYYACWSELITPQRARQLARIGLCTPREAGIPRPPRDGAGSSARGARPGPAWDDRGPASARQGGSPPSHGRRVSYSGRWGNLRLQLGSGGAGPLGRPLTLDCGDGAESDHTGDEDTSYLSSDRSPSTEGHSSSSTDSSVEGSSLTETYALAPLHHKATKPARKLSGDNKGRDTIIGSRVVFLQMEFCQTTLANHLAQRASVDRLENIVIALQLIAGLRHLHRRGILHRDIKPNNVLLDFRCQYANLDDGSDSSLDAEGENEDTDEAVSEGDVCVPRWCCSAWREMVDVPNRSVGALVPTSQRPDLNYFLHLSGLWCGATPSLNDKYTNMRVMLPSRAPFQDFNLHKSQILANKTNIVEPNYDEEAISLLMNTPHCNAEDFIIQNRRHFSSVQSSSFATATIDSPVTAAVASTLDAEVRKTTKWLQRMLVQVRLSDFGLAKLLNHPGFDGVGKRPSATKGVNTTGVGSPIYSSPEQLGGGVCTSASDAFSFGILLAELYILPKTMSERLEVLRNVRDDLFPNERIIQTYPELAIVRSLTRRNPDERLSLVKAQSQLRIVLHQLIAQVYGHHSSFTQKRVTT